MSTESDNSNITIATFSEFVFYKRKLTKRTYGRAKSFQIMGCPLPTNL